MPPGPKNVDTSIPPAREQGAHAVGKDSRVIPALAGVGSRKLTDSLAATHFIRSADPAGDYVMELVVFLKGEPGWTSQKTGWAFDASSRIAFSEYKFFSGPLRAELDRVTGEVSILDHKAQTSRANVFVVGGVGGPKLTVTYSKHQDLHTPFDADPMRVFVSHSVSLQNALGLGVAPVNASSNGPIFVTRGEGAVMILGTAYPVDFYITKYEREGSL